MKYSIPVALLSVLVLAVGVSAEPPIAKIVLQSLSHQLIENYGLPEDTRVSSGISTVGVGTPVYLDAEGTDPDGGEITGTSWTLTATPDGSAAELVDGPMGWMMLVPDMRGQYTVELTVTDDQGESSDPATQVITAGLWVGVGTVGGATPDPGIGQCGLCHKDQTDAWAETGHASMLQRGLDGIASSHYNANCIECHSVGYDEDPLALNDGFDDVAAETGWTFPDTLMEGNFDALPPELKAVANIQCENCHGPGSEHIGDPATISMSLAAGDCGRCHDEEPYHVKNIEWRESAHAVATTYPSGPGRESCVICHAGWGFVDFAEGNDPPRTDYAPITCAVCHDPHDATNEHQVRLMDDVELGNGETVTFGGPSKLCMNCHKSRRDSEEYVKEYHRHYGPHHGPQADMLAGTNAIEYGATIGSSMHRVAVEEGCVGCHMAPTPGADEPGQHKIGAHTFAMAWTDEETGQTVENVAACEECHGEMEDFDRPLGFDYDGDGTIEGVQSEVEGLLHTLGMALPPLGDPEVTVTEDYTPAQLKAAYNYFFVEEDGSFGIHNAHYALGLLQLAIRDLTGGVVGAMVTADLPAASAIAGQMLTVPITVDNASGLAGADVVVTYDPTILTAVSAQGTGLGADLAIASNVSEGRIAIAAAGAARMGVGGGPLLSLTFQVAEDAVEGSASDLTFESLTLRDINGTAVLSVGEAGSVTIRPVIVGDVNNDGSVNAGDAILALRIAVGLLGANEYQAVAADVNQDGEINSADVILILQKAVGLPVAKGMPSVRSPKVEILSAGGSADDLIVVPIRLSEALGIAGGDLSLVYDSDRWTPIRVEAELEGLIAANLNDPGRVRIGWAQADGLDRDELVLNVWFRGEGQDSGSLRLEDVVLFDGMGHPASAMVEGMTLVANRLPERFVLSQNVPNPFNAETTIPYQLPADGEVSLVIYGTAGQVVRTLVAGSETAGYKTVVWDGRDDGGRSVAAGMYVYRLTVGDFTSMKKMLLLK